MQPSPKPREELGRARAAVERMRKATSFPEFEEHWREFLRRLDRVWNKAEAHYVRHRKWHSWSGKYTTARSNDELLSYLVQARNVDEHTVAEIVTHQPGSLALGTGPSGSAHYQRLSIFKDGRVYVQATGDPKVTITPSRAKLLPVTSRGRTYQVPTSHIGGAIDAKNVPDTADKAVAFYDTFVSEAEKYFSREA